MKKIWLFALLLFLACTIVSCAPGNSGTKGKEGEKKPAVKNLKNESEIKDKTAPESRSEPAGMNASGVREILIQIKENTDADFSDPHRATFSWNINNGGEISVNGWEIKAGVNVNGNPSVLKEKANAAARYLASHGFDSDQANTTEITTGLKKGKMACLIVLPWTDSLNTSGRYPIKVQCGYLR